MRISGKPSIYIQGRNVYDNHMIKIRDSICRFFEKSFVSVEKYESLIKVQ